MKIKLGKAPKTKEQKFKENLKIFKDVNTYLESKEII